MSDVRGILKGGPHHGRVMSVQPGSQVIIIPYLPEPPAIVIELPRWRWWHRLLRRPHPLPPEPPKFRDLIYRLTDEERPDGKLVYRYEAP